MTGSRMRMRVPPRSIASPGPSSRKRSVSDGKMRCRSRRSPDSVASGWRSRTRPTPPACGVSWWVQTTWRSGGAPAAEDALELRLDRPAGPAGDRPPRAATSARRSRGTSSCSRAGSARGRAARGTGRARRRRASARRQRVHAAASSAPSSARTCAATASAPTTTSRSSARGSRPGAAANVSARPGAGSGAVRAPRSHQNRADGHAIEQLARGRAAPRRRPSSTGRRACRARCARTCPT